MNYSRPNGGYESEPWRKNYNVEESQIFDPITVLEHKAKGHKVILALCKPGSVHSAAYRCVECNKHLGWANKTTKRTSIGR